MPLAGTMMRSDPSESSASGSSIAVNAAVERCPKRPVAVMAGTERVDFFEGIFSF